MPESPAVGRFRASLAGSAVDFSYVSEPSEDRADIRFIGKFQGSEVVWDATVMTLKHYNASQLHHGGPTTNKQFIDVASTGTEYRRIVIGLAVACIDQPALLKTMVMVRKYKRLQPGRHEFGGAG